MSDVGAGVRDDEDEEEEEGDDDDCGGGRFLAAIDDDLVAFETYMLHRREVMSCIEV